MKNLLHQTLPLAALLLSVLSFCNQSAMAQGHVSAHNNHGVSTAILFVYDPSRTGTVDAFYVNKSNRLAAYLKQTHTALDTACGYVFHGLEGTPLAGSTYGIDLSNDTKITDRAIIVLVGRAGRTFTKHTALGLHPADSFPSGPGWTSYRYNISQFSPPISPGEVQSSLSVSLLGGRPPSTHQDHWASRPWINGRFQNIIINHKLNLSRTNGYTVLPDVFPF